MKLTFFGAAHAVTGSCHCLEVNGKKILIDCGLQQGRDEHDENALDFAPSYIDYVIVTHAHIDHSGRIPLLVKEGFQGQIFATRLTCQLMSVMLRDSAFIQESDAEWQNQKASAPAGRRWSPVHCGRRRGRPSAALPRRVRPDPGPVRRCAHPLPGRGAPSGLLHGGDLGHRGRRH
mgnify:CR=1 FL=1